MPDEKKEGLGIQVSKEDLPPPNIFNGIALIKNRSETHENACKEGDPTHNYKMRGCKIYGGKAEKP